MRVRLAAALLLVLGAGILSAPAGAGAQVVRLPQPPLGSFSEARGLAFDQGANQVYAIDGRSEVQRITFSATAQAEVRL